MKSAIAKRSIVLRGHKTSVSLESEFWEGMREIAERRQIALSALLQQIDAERNNANLSSAIRIYVLDFYRRQVEESSAPVLARNPAAQKATEFEPID